MSNYFILTGESSGDRLGALLGRGLLDNSHKVNGWGGPNMKSAGINLLQNIDQMTVMGWSDLVGKIPFFLKLFNRAKEQIKSLNTDILILIDFGGFNLRLAKWANNIGVKVVYYSPPKVWASRKYRLKSLRKYCDQIIVLFPFEQQWYEHNGLKVEYFGHPFAEEIKSYVPNFNFRQIHGIDKKPILSVLPGSRASEVRQNLPIYLKALSGIDAYHICISCAPGLEEIICKICESTNKEYAIVKDEFYDLIAHSHLSIVTSGTASLECALFRIPHVVCYRTSALNYAIAKRIIDVPFISLPNLIEGRKVVTELIQSDMSEKKINQEVVQLSSEDVRTAMINHYNAIERKLSLPHCIERTVEYISNL